MTGVRLRGFGLTDKGRVRPTNEDCFAIHDELGLAIHLASMRIREAAFTSHDCAGMGTTLVTARVSAGRVSVAHVGDSRLYLLAGRRLQQLTEDDSWMTSKLAHDPDADPFLLQHHPMRCALTNVVGTRSRTEVHVVEHALAGGDLLLLTTDGVHGVLDAARIAQLLLAESEPRAMAHRLISAALARGSRDNCTAVAARYISA